MPQKLRVGKQWNKDSGCPASPARVSVASSISTTSLNEIDEVDELETEDGVAPTLKSDEHCLARTPSPEAKVKIFNSFIEIPVIERKVMNVWSRSVLRAKFVGCFYKENKTLHF